MIKSAFYLASLLVILASCGKSDGRESVLKIAADSSTFSLVKVLGEDFSKQSEDVAFELQVRNEPTAISGFVEGETHLLFSKRTLFMEERASIEKDSQTLEEFPLAKGAILVLANAQNTDLVAAQNKLQYTQGVVHEDPLLMRYVNGPTTMVPGKKELRAQVLQNDKFLGLIFSAASPKPAAVLNPLKVQAVNGKLPSYQSVEKGDYPLTRQIFIQYVKPQSKGLASFTKYLKSENARKVLQDNNWVPVSEE